MPKPRRRLRIPWTHLQLALVIMGGWLAVTSGPRSLLADPSDGTWIRAASVSRDSIEVDWQLLASLDYRTGEMSEELESVAGQGVKVPGFMVPLEDWAGEVSEFLLVPYVGACVHTPPPPPNQLVYVKMENDQRVPVSFWDPVWIHGILTVEKTTNLYGSVSFKMDGTSITPYEW
ncbi:MAG: DUF3299 domain-containing protein [Gemmatimonadetes bacterium]|nr:DUF3299 domain-containing protein [Gemmatimonadota bacterium]